MRITADLLLGLGACEAQIELFDFVFPDGADLTRENARLALDAGLEIDWLVAEPAVPLWVAKRIVRCCAPHPNWWLPLVGLAQRPDVSGFRLWALSRHRSSPVRDEVARNDRTPVFVLRRLARDPSPDARAGVCFHPRTPAAVLWRLLQNDCNRVAEIAREELALRGLA